MARPFKHGFWNHPLYATWNHMKFRCYNKKCKFYSDYGGRGIYIVERWLSLENFIEDMSPKPLGTSLDRIDNDGPYSKENCRWATNIQQNGNRRGTKFHTIDGRTESIAEWCRILRLNYKEVWRRINKGWSIEKAFSIPISKSNGGLVVHGKLGRL